MYPLPHFIFFYLLLPLNPHTFRLHTPPPLLYFSFSFFFPSIQPHCLSLSPFYLIYRFLFVRVCVCVFWIYRSTSTGSIAGETFLLLLYKFFWFFVFCVFCDSIQGMLLFVNLFIDCDVIFLSVKS